MPIGFKHTRIVVGLGLASGCSAFMPPPPLREDASNSRPDAGRGHAEDAGGVPYTPTSDYAETKSQLPVTPEASKTKLPNDAGPFGGVPPTENTTDEPVPTPIPGGPTCTPGEFVDNGACSHCQAGYFSAIADASSCKKWTTCTPGQRVTSAGETTEDRTCDDCKDGTYSTSSNAVACVSFTRCGDGEYISKPGTRDSDQECKGCEDGTFSRETNAASCSPQTTCVKGEYVAEEGTSSRDRVCMGCGGGTFSTTNNAETCTLHEKCGDQEIEQSPGTKTTDRICACAEGHIECNGECVPTTLVTYYPDADEDSFGDSTRPLVDCQGAPNGYVSNGSDCCDADSNANPSQAQFFPEPTSCGGYDFDCNGSATFEYNQIAACGGGGGSCGCSEGWTSTTLPDCGSVQTYAPGGNSCSGFPTRTQRCR